MTHVKKKYKLRDGKTIHAIDDQEFVLRLWNSSFSRSKTIEDYMTRFAKRAKKMAPNSEIRTDNTSVFTEDLIKYDLVTVTDPNTSQSFN